MIVCVQCGEPSDRGMIQLCRKCSGGVWVEQIERKKVRAEIKEQGKIRAWRDEEPMY